MLLDDVRCDEGDAILFSGLLLALAFPVNGFVGGYVDAGVHDPWFPLGEGGE